jgi:pilus assembly protein CpaC
VHRGLPFISDLPVLGIPFRRVSEEVNEIELLILVTPEFVDAMDPHEVPQCGPGMESVSPSHMDLYCKGYIEAPACGPCGPGMANGCQGCSAGSCNLHGGEIIGQPATATDGQYFDVLPGEPYPSSPDPTLLPAPVNDGGALQYDPSANVGVANRYYTAQLPAGASGTVNPAYRHIPNGQAAPQQQTRGATSTPGLIGPIGYDVQK